MTTTMGITPAASSKDKSSGGAEHIKNQEEEKQQEQEQQKQDEENHNKQQQQESTPSLSPASMETSQQGKQESPSASWAQRSMNMNNNKNIDNNDNDNGNKKTCSFQTSNPPLNCPDGGQWGVVKYIGNKTGVLVCLGCFLGGICGLCVLACPQDEKDAYSVNGALYDAAGAYMGLTKKYKFTPTRN